MGAATLLRRQARRTAAGGIVLTARESHTVGTGEPVRRPARKLDTKVHWCPRHLKPYRDRWPSGVDDAMAVLVYKAMSDPRVVDFCGVDEDGQADARMLGAALDEFSPLCCLIGDDAMAQIYLATVPKG